MSFNETKKLSISSNFNNIGEEIKENDFPVLKKLIGELAGNLDKYSQYLKKDKDLIDEFLRENQKLFDNITLALKGELKKKNHSKASQLPKLEKTVAELERRLRLANSTLNCLPRSFQDKSKKPNVKDKNLPIDEESHALINEEEKENLVAQMDFEVHEENLKDREVRIQAVNRNLKEVNKLYSEIAEMGKQQSEHVELIGENIEKTAAKVYNSKRELLKAKEMFDKTRDRYCKTLCCLIILFFIIFFFFLYSNK